MKARSETRDQPHRKHTPEAVLERLPAGDLVHRLSVDGGSSLQAQIARLVDPRLRIAQRQAIAAEVGQLHGNRHLARLGAASLARVIQRNNRSVADVLAEQGVQAEGYRLSATVRMAPGQTLISTDYATVESGAEGTGIELYINRDSIVIDFGPPLIVVPRLGGYQIARRIEIEYLCWSFAEQRLNARYTGPLGLALIEDRLMDAMVRRLQAVLPSRMFRRGYDPFTDRQLPGELPSLARQFGTGTTGGATVPRTTLTEVSAAITLSEPVRRSVARGESITFEIPAGTQIVVTARLGRVVRAAAQPGEPPPPPSMAGGELPTSLSELGIEEISIRAEGARRPMFDVCVAGLPAIRVQEAILSFGGQLQLRYGMLGERTLRGGELPLQRDELVEWVEQELREYILSSGLPQWVAGMAGMSR